jgi:aminopeptidase N
MLRQLARAAHRGRMLPPTIRTTGALNQRDTSLVRGASGARCLLASSSSRSSSDGAAAPTPPTPHQAPQQPQQQSLPKPLLRSAYEPPAFAVPSVRLEFDLDPTETVVTTSLDVRCTTITTKGSPSSSSGSSIPDLVLDGDDIALRSVHVNGKPVTSDVRVEGGKLTIPAAVLRLAVNGAGHSSSGGNNDALSFRVDIVGSVCPRDNASGSGLYIDGGGSFMTQCEANGFRQIAFFLDRPDVLSLYDVTLRGAAARFPVLLSNGNLVSDEVDEATGKRVAVWRDPHPKPCYLFALVAGDLAHIRDHFTTRSGRDVDLYMYSERKDLGDLGFAMASLKQSMAWDEARYCIFRRGVACVACVACERECVACVSASKCA